MRRPVRTLGRGSSCTMGDVHEVRARYERLRRVMDERVTRLWAAAEAEAFGYGGVAAVHQATGISESRMGAAPSASGSLRGR